MLTAILSAPIRQTAGMIVAQEGNAVATYSRRFYRETQLVPDSEPVLSRYERKLPLKLDGVDHMIAIPTGHV